MYLIYILDFHMLTPLGIPLNEEVYGTDILHLHVHECCIIFTVYTIIKYFLLIHLYIGIQSQRISMTSFVHI